MAASAVVPLGRGPFLWRTGGDLLGAQSARVRGVSADLGRPHCTSGGSAVWEIDAERTVKIAPARRRQRQPQGASRSRLEGRERSGGRSEPRA